MGLETGAYAGRTDFSEPLRLPAPKAYLFLFLIHVSIHHRPHCVY